MMWLLFFVFFFFTDTATTEIYPLSLHDALPISPGVAVRTGEVCHVRGGEHFFRCLASLHCAAAPVRDASGRTVAMLDLSSEAGPFRFDAGAMAHMYATCIENRLLGGAARMHLLLRFQSSRSMFGTPLAGLAAVDGEGMVRWFNGVGAQLFDSPRRPAEGLAAEEGFGRSEEGRVGKECRSRWS